jgi:uncharacterized protein (TIGR02147 family)
MGIFDHSNYQDYLRAHIKSLPKNGRGELSKIAQILSINTTLLSQIMAGTRVFNSEQAYSLSMYLGHNELEMDYFALLVQFERASTHDLKSHLKKKIEALKAESLKLSRRVSYEKRLSEQERSIFYSSWIYSAVHIFTSLEEKGVTRDEISRKFSISKVQTSKIIQFLTSTGIIKESDGRFSPGVQSTFIEQGSPHLLKHHSSWRIKAIQKSEKLSDSELMVTGQYSLAREDFLFLREKLTEVIKTINKKVKDTKPEEIVCLNIDWFFLSD